MMGRGMVVAVSLSLLTGVAMGQHELRLYFSTSNTIGVVPPEFVNQEVPAIAIGETAYLWAHVQPGDRWIGITLGFTGLNVGAGMMYNPQWGGNGQRWDGGDFDPAGDNAILLVAVVARGLGDAGDPLVAPGGHYLVGELTYNYNGYVYLAVGTNGLYRLGATAPDPVYFGFGDDPVLSDAFGATSSMHDLLVGGGGEPYGACCLNWGDCIETLEWECYDYHMGQWQGLWTTCYPNPCPPPPMGACCLPDGLCMETQSWDCYGMWMGPGSLCYPNPCPQPGACCSTGGECYEVIEWDCWTGVWLGPGSSCYPNPCPQPGACCHPDGSCTLSTVIGGSDCTGVYLGDDTVCDPNPCPQPVCAGDCGCDGVINWRDIDYFVAAMNDNQAAWEAMFAPGTPSCPFANNDVNGDGTVNWRDIDPLVAVMNTVCP